MKNILLSELSNQYQKLLDSAWAAIERSYSPYSQFQVGAALLSDTGEVVLGANFENASYGGCICAERSALLNANMAGHRKFSAIAVIAKSQHGPTEDVTAPCGICRQLLFEASQLGGADIEVILSDTSKSKIVLTSVRELLPLGFGPADLGA